MPAAAKLMAEHDLPVGSVPGTGRDGRVTKGDVLGAVESGARQAGRGGRRPPRRDAAPAPRPAPPRPAAAAVPAPTTPATATGRSSACR